MKKRQIEIELIAQKILALEQDKTISDEERMQQMTEIMENLDPYLLLEAITYADEIFS